MKAACGHVGRRRGSSSREQPRGPSSGAQEGRWGSTGSSAPGALGFSTFCPAHAKPGDSGDWHWSLGRVLSPQKHAAMQDFTAHVSAQDRRRRLLLREEKGRRVCSLVMQLEGASVSSGAVSGCCHRTMNSCCQGGTPVPLPGLRFLCSPQQILLSPGPAPPASHITSLHFSQVVHIFLLPDRCSHRSCCMFPPLMPGREPVPENSPKHISDVACHQSQKN